MDYNKLKIFQLVAETGSVGKAAKILHVTQPAVSQQLIALEDQLGFKLLRRAHGTLTLSPEATTLLAKLRDGFDVIEAAVAAVRDSNQMMEGHIRLGVLMDHSTTFSLAKTLMGFSKLHAGVTFDIQFGTNSEIESGLHKGTLDLGLSIVFEEPRALTREPVKTAKHCFVSQKTSHKIDLEHILESQRLIDFSQDFLCLTPWVLKNKPDVISILKGRRPSLIVPNHLTAFELVESGWGCAVLPEYICKELIEAGKIQRLGPLDLNVVLDIASTKERTLRSYERAFVEFIKQPSFYGTTE
jgi:DNA-binding transcriptional LysR family regulator